MYLYLILLLIALMKRMCFLKGNVCSSDIFYLTELAKILEQMRAEMKNMQSTILLQDARINTQDARIKAQDAHTKAQDAHIKAQDAHIKAQDAKIAQQDARMAQLENQVGQMTNTDKESTNTNNGLRGHKDATSGSMNDSLPNTSTKLRRNMIGEQEIFLYKKK